MKVATLALIVKDGHLLLGQRSRKGTEIGELMLNGPGGKVKEGQTPFECLTEEVQEEVGLTIQEEHAKEVGVVVFHNEGKSDYHVHVFLVSDYSGALTESDEMKMPEGGWWYPLENLPFESMLVSDRDWIPRALKGVHFTAQVYQSEDGTKLTQPIEYSPE